MGLDGFRQFHTGMFVYPRKPSNDDTGIPSPRTEALPTAHHYTRVSSTPVFPSFSDYLPAFGKGCDMEMFQPRHLPLRDNTLIAFGCHPLLFVDQPFITKKALKRDVYVVLAKVRAIYLRPSRRKSSGSRHLTQIPTDTGVLESRPTVQGLRNIQPSDISSFNVHRDDSGLCASPHCDARWTSASTASSFIWGLEDALSTSTTFTIAATTNTPALTNVPKPLGMGVDCFGDSSGGTDSGKCGFAEV
jgi:hypothetical protein